MNLTHIKDFNNFTLNGYKRIVEHIGDGGDNAFNKIFKKGPDIIFTTPSGEKVVYKRIDIVNAVQKAVDEEMYYNFSTYFPFVREFSIIYLLGCKDMTTMAVDDHMNLYIDALFVARDLKMDPKLISAVLMHEIFHVVYNHVERSKNWLSANSLPMNKQNMLEMNMAGDIEVNTTLVRKGIISIDRLQNEIHGLYLKEIQDNILPMESIRENEEYMNKLRRQCKEPEGGQGGASENKTINTTKEFDEGYVEMMNKIADIVNKYGPEAALEKLAEAGAIAGEQIIDDFDASQIFAMNFMTIKSFDEFIFEKNQNKPQGEPGYSTKEDGYRAGLKKCIEEIKSALGGNEGGDDQEGPGGDGPSININTNIDPYLLKRMNLPQNNKKGKGKQGKGNSLPQNVKDNQMSPDGPESDNNDDSQGGSQGGGKEGFKDHLSNKSSNGNGQENGENNGGVEISYGSGKGELDKTAIGKTGSFFGGDENVSDSLKEAIENTYVDENGNVSKELIDEVMEEIKENNRYNTKEAIEKKREDLYNSLGDRDPIKIIWDEARKSEKQYKAMWKKLLKDFLKNKTRYARKEVESNMIKYMNKRKMSVAKVAPTEIMIGQDVQDINVYVDVSGSINMELVTLFVESLVVFMDTFKYSGINIALWADGKPAGPFKIDCSKKGGRNRVVNDIINIIETKSGGTGGGTHFRNSGVPVIIKNIMQYKGRKKKDDVHIILTDGYLSDSINGLEDYIISKVQSETHSTSIAKKTVENCMWMLYDNFNDNWEKDINYGKVVRISSKNFRPE